MHQSFPKYMMMVPTTYAMVMSAVSPKARKVASQLEKHAAYLLFQYHLLLADAYKGY